MLRTLRPKTCEICGQQFAPFQTTQRVCGIRCAQRVAKVLRAKGKKELRERKEKLRTNGERKALAQKAVNLFVRTRDAGKPCISCKTTQMEGAQAGHYRSRGSAPHLALDPRNIRLQCVRCNLHLHGNPIGFRAGLVEAEGEAYVLELEADQRPRHYSGDDYDRIATDYRAKARELKKGLE